MKKNYNTILFDLDGTLTDPKVGIVNSVKYALKKLGKEESSDERITNTIGSPLKNIFKDLYNLNDEDIKIAINMYREYFSTQGMLENEVYPGMKDLLNDLYKANKKLIVATLKPTVYTVEILKNFKLDEYFYFISGTDLEAENISKTRVIMKSLEELGDEAEKEIVMIGDRNHDMIGAKSNNIDSIGVLYGYGTEDELKSEGAKYIVNSIDELRNLII